MAFVLFSFCCIANIESLAVADDEPVKSIAQKTADEDTASVDTSVEEPKSIEGNDDSLKEESPKDEPPVKDADAPEPGDKSPATTVQQPVMLPSNTPDGRPFRPIGIFQSQLAELVPDSYVPVALSKLSRAVDESIREILPPQEAQIRNAYYVVRLRDDTLVSDRSTIDIQYDGVAVTRLSLGKVNVAIDPLPTRSIVTNDSLPRLESHADGTLSAVVDGDSNVSFVWSLRGKQRGVVREFDLQIPRSPQTRIELATPRGVMIESLDGVVWQLPAPPPGLDGVSAESESQWWRIDAGGLNTVRLRVRSAGESLESDALIIRRASTQYDVEPSGVSWTCRMTVQLPTRDNYPPLVIRSGSLLSVSIDAIDVPFSTLVKTANAQIVQLGDLVSGQPRPTSPATVTISGFSSWDDKSGWCDLPMPAWLASRVIQTSATSQAQIRVSDPMQVLSWTLPSTWVRQQIDSATATVSVLQAEGPPLDSLAIMPTTDASALESSPFEAVASAPHVPWSRVRLANRVPLRAYDMTLAFAIGEGLLDAKARIVIEMDPNRIEPLQFRLQRGWNLLSMSMPTTGRSIETPTIDPKTNMVTIWPESSDVIKGRIVIEATGRNRLTTADRGFSIPASWFLRPEGLRGVMTAAMNPPPTLKWSGETTMRVDRLSPDALSPDQASFIGTLSPDALLFRPDVLRTPTLFVQPPSVSFSVTSLLRLEQDGDDWSETLEIETDATNPLLTTLNVVTGPLEGRPPITWLLRSFADAPPVSLPSSSITFDPSDENGTYLIDLSNRDLRGKTLIGKRRYPTPERLRVELPRVPEAVSQNAEVLLDEGIEIVDRSQSVVRVPIPLEQIASMEPGVADGAGATAANAGLTASSSKDESNNLAATPKLEDLSPLSIGSASTRMRYDPVDQPSIELRPSRVNANVNLVWNKQTRLIASSRGIDLVELRLGLSATEPIVISHSPDMKLTSVFRDEIATHDYVTTGDSVTLKPLRRSESIRMVWTRHQIIQGWWRACKVPRFDVAGVTVHEETRMFASSDSFIPATLWLGVAQTEPGEGGCDVRPGASKIVAHNNVVLSLGWLFSILVFATSWSLARRSAALVGATIAVAASVAVLWSPWALAVIGWFIVPATSALLLMTSVEHRQWIEAWSRRYNDRGTRSSRHNDSRPGDRRLYGERGLNASSTGMPLGSVLWWAVLAIVAWSVTQSIAQDTSSPSLPNTKVPAASVPLLVPVDARGHMSGDKVYVPGTVYESLFTERSDSEPEQVRFQFADYRLKVETSLATPPTLSAEYVVRVDRPSMRIALPIRSESVRRVELLGPDNDRIVRFAARDENSIIVTVPPAPLFRLRVTLIPNVATTPQGSQIDLRVPRITSARLTVDLDRTVESVSIENAAGRVVNDPDLRRSVADLGPVDRIAVRYVQRDNASGAVGQNITRRYWVQCGQDETAVDCEIMPAVPVPSGQTIELVVSDTSLPTVASSNWQLVRSERVLPLRRQLTLMSLSDTPSPIRLLWTLESQVNEPGAPGEQIAMALPDVNLPTSTGPSPVWVAIHSDPSLRVAPSSRSVVESLAVDQFLAGWSGYRDRIDRAYVAIDRIPPIVLIRSERPQSNIVSHHHLQVSSSELQLRYRASISTPENDSVSRSLLLPKGLELLSLTVNGARVDSQLLSGPDGNEVILGPLSSASPVLVSAVASTPLSSSGRFSPPRLEIWPPSATSDTYTLSRDTNTRIRTITPSPLSNALPDNVLLPGNVTAGIQPTQPLMLSRPSDAELLATGWIPVSTWTIQQSSDDARARAIQSKEAGSIQAPLANTVAPERPASMLLPGGVFEATAQANRFATNQLIVLEWSDGRWSMATHIQIPAGSIPDFIDVEVPTRWCDSLDVTPAATWSRQPSTDPALQVIRVQCDPNSSADAMITIRGQLKSTDKARISVPAVSVLGNGRRRVFVSVPGRLTNEPIRWRSSAVSAVELAPLWQSMVPATSTERATYAAAGPGWSIELASQPRATASASITGAETQVYLSGASGLVLVRLDLVPAGLSSVDIELPSEATLIGAWSANRAVAVNPVTDPTDSRVQVPLFLDRLSQPVELLYRMPSNRILQGDCFVAVMDIDQPIGWFTLYAPNATSNDNRYKNLFDASVTPVDRELTSLSLAVSVVEAVERSFDNLAERPADEIATWLVPWVVRYESLCLAAGRPVDLSNLSDGSVAPVSADKGASTGGSSPTKDLNADQGKTTQVEQERERRDERWAMLDRRLGVIMDRFMPDASISAQSRERLASPFDSAGFEGFQPVATLPWQPSKRAPAIRWPSEASGPLGVLIRKTLALAFVVSLVISLWRLRHNMMPLIHHPALWLGVIAVCGFFVAPIPVAASLLMVAIVLPMFPRHESS